MDFPPNTSNKKKKNNLLFVEKLMNGKKDQRENCKRISKHSGQSI